ncbi:MAG: OmpA family protein [Nannocystaceae bacterium]
MITHAAYAPLFALSLANAAPTSDDAAAGGAVSLSTADGAKADGAASAEGAKEPAKEPAKKSAKKTAKKSATGDEVPWIKRYAPERNLLEIGVFGGVLFTSPQHELYDPNLTWERYKKVAPDVGLRVGFYPLRFLGVEVEGAAMPTKTASDQGAVLYGVRGHAIAQLPWRIAPFVLAGVGGLGTSGSSLGKDLDLAVHFGGGVKFFLTRLLALRVDVRDNVAAAHNIGDGYTNHVEVLVGLSATLGRKKATSATTKRIDSDGDGLYDPGQGVPAADEDRCPNEPGPRANQGCPLKDSDGDGLYDPGQGAPEDEVDACPDDAGPRETKGCPLKDSDGDGLYDPGQGVPAADEDACPSEPGPRETKGCPPKDRDGDGIFDPGQGVSPEDQCPDKPETVNDYQDEDGCPDEVPKAVAKFTGAIRGINFDVDKDTITAGSKKTLDAAVKVLRDFPDVRIEVSGHTDSDGAADHNRDLSRRRAEAVKKYLVDAGIAGARVETRGAGPDEPIADNATKRGKAQNRRIEFKLLKGKMEGGK